MNNYTPPYKISSKIVNDLIDKKLLYADKNNNCVFVNKNNTFEIKLKLV